LYRVPAFRKIPALPLSTPQPSPHLSLRIRNVGTTAFPADSLSFLAQRPSLSFHCRLSRLKAILRISLSTMAQANGNGNSNAEVGDQATSIELSKPTYSVDGISDEVNEAATGDDVYSQANPLRPGFTKRDQRDMWRMGKVQELKVSNLTPLFPTTHHNSHTLHIILS